ARRDARDAVAPATPTPPQEGRQRQPGRDPRPHRRVDQDAAVEAREPRLAPAGLAVGDVAGHPALIARPQRSRRGVGDDRLDAAAALAGDELGVLLREPAARAEERGLDRRPAHAEPLADLAVAEALELAHHEDLVMGLG